jgi:hypothetical protein
VHAGVLELITLDLRAIVRFLAERNLEPSAAILDGRTLQSAPENGSHAGYDGAKKKKGSKVHVAVDTLGNLLALKVTAANEQERAQVSDLAKQVQRATGARLRSGTLIRATPAKIRRSKPKTKGSGWRWSSIAKPNEGL